jgi:IclR family acetate operon transcriptional repressor
VGNILSQPMKTFTEKTVTSPEGIRAQLEEIRRQGYALDYEEFEHGVCAIAAPIFNRSGNIIAAIGGPSPMSRMTPERIQQIAEAFMEAAKGISHRMGYRS